MFLQFSVCHKYYDVLSDFAYILGFYLLRFLSVCVLFCLCNLCMFAAFIGVINDDDSERERKFTSAKNSTEH